MKKIKLIFLLLLTLMISSCSLINNNPNPEIPPVTENQQPENEKPVEEEKPEEENKPVEDEFEDYGFEIIEIDLDSTSITEDGLYTSLAEVSVYIYTYHKLPKNYKVKGVFNKRNYSSTTLESCGGDRFYNREGLLPTASGRTFTECDIDYKGGSRNAKRIVYSSDFIIFYTDDHYTSFKILRFV